MCVFFTNKVTIQKFCVDLFTLFIMLNLNIFKLSLSVIYMGVSENSVPLNPMVNDHYPY